VSATSARAGVRPDARASADAPTADELVTRTRLDLLAAQVDRVEGKITALLVAALTTLAAELIRSLTR
jgi:hypothetical protein